MKMMRWLHARSKDVAVVLLAAMFLTFILQIFMRYVVGYPLGWTLEVCLLIWLWLVFWSSAFLIREQEHVRFDLIYAAVQPKTSRIFNIISGTIVVVGFAITYRGTVDFVTFMKIEKTAVTLIRLDFVFSIYLLFLTSVIILGGIRLSRLLFGGARDTDKREEQVEP
jgi:TRAP-type C4-dicarboxylate transport system permease small subunit